MNDPPRRKSSGGLFLASTVPAGQKKNLKPFSQKLVNLRNYYFESLMQTSLT
jgi:hypothetical protein